MGDGFNISEVLESKVWTFAKTMPDNPHFWSVVKDWEDADEFRLAVEHINAHGEPKVFGPRTYIVFNLNGWRYWTMERDTSKTVLINRAEGYL
jgi:hypothetical protein